MSKKTTFHVSEEQMPRLAVLIDADNASVASIEPILLEVAKFGEVTVKRIYGNFVGANSQLKQVINDHAIKVMQQFAFTSGKNATDGFMIIDAMDLLYTGHLDGFCIVSSDSDFTALAIRLKEHGVKVYGFGKKQTPKAFINACSQFIYVEHLLPKSETSLNKPMENEQHASQKPAVSSTTLPLSTLQDVFDTCGEEEWVSISAFGATWKRLQNDMDPRAYGCKNFSALVKKYSDVFEHKIDEIQDGKQEMFLKLKIKS